LILQEQRNKKFYSFAPLLETRRFYIIMNNSQNIIGMAINLNPLGILLGAISIIIISVSIIIPLMM